ncbi:uncharacterized protein LOC132551031 [Ylistrum balloti]|uniref:uncharacterized protein LOC132551031 n=1 Tax=Ylistrum balloti TaxID=509963 RepID=UPI002905ACBD|nr:uncharacterized protein LOC132551031 [Ylistrum balloti]
MGAFAGYRRVCYYTNWSRYRYGLGRYFPNNTDPHLCTHIVFAFAKLEKSELAVYEDDETLYEEINKLKLTNPSLKTMIAVGGWNQESIEWSDLVSKTNKMNKFIVKSIPFIRRHGFDGLDLDWEYPALRTGANATTDKHNFAVLCKKLRLAYDREARLTGQARLLLSVAVAASKKIVDVSYEVPTISRYVDFINLMSYDLHGSWLMQTGHHSLLHDRGYNSDNAEDIYLDIDWAARYWVLLGASKEQMNIGLSFYGRGFTLKDPNDSGFGAPTKGPSRPGPFTRESGYMAYYEICLLLARGGQMNRDAGEPIYINGNQWIGYDDEISISKKVAWLIHEGFGGAMMWALPLDDFNQECPLSRRKFPLANRVKDDLLAADSTVTGSETTTTSGQRLVCFYDVLAAYRPGIGAFIPTDIDSNLCTHLVFANAMVRSSTPVLYRRRVTDISYYDDFTNLTNTNPSLKTLIMVSEDTKGMEISAMAENSTYRNLFASSCIQFCRKHGFDGLVLQWTVPNGNDFRLLSEDLRAAFQAENTSVPLLLVAQLAGDTIDNINTYYDINTLKSTIETNYDFVNLHTFSLYDSSPVTAHHSRLRERDGSIGADKFLNIKAIAEYYVFLGIPKSMINVGIATYGRGFTLASNNNTSVGDAVTGDSTAGNLSDLVGFMSYYEICYAIQNGDGTGYSDYGEPYYVQDSQWIGYDDVNSVREKAEWVVGQEYGGISMFSLTFDDYSQYCNISDVSFPLINTIKDVYTEESTPKLFRRVCYVSTWSEDRPGDGQFQAQDIDPFLCTHIIVAFAKVSDDNTLEPVGSNYTGIYDSVTALRTNNTDLKVLISVGGWEQGSESFSFMVSRPKRRRSFVSSAIQFMKDYGFDGIDLAWLYPAQRSGSNEETDKKNFATLVQLFRSEIDAESISLLLSAAVAAEQSHIDYAYDVKSLAENVDFLNIQTFDMHGFWDGVTGHHSQLRPFPYQTGTDANLNYIWSADYWEMRGVDKQKINIGVATFGRGFNVSDENMGAAVGLPIEGPSLKAPFTEEEGFMAYYELCDLPAQVADLGDAIIKYGSNNLWIGYDDPAVIVRKMLWLISEDYGGVMVWSLDLDDFRGNCSLSTGPYPLLNAVKDTLINYADGDFPDPLPVPTTSFDTTTMTETTTPIPTTTQEDFIDCNNSTTGGPYPNPNDCRTFYKCVDGVSHLYNCPGNTSYDRAHRVCNYDRFTNC